MSSRKALLRTRTRHFKRVVMQRSNIGGVMSRRRPSLLRGALEVPYRRMFDFIARDVEG
jgi:hypothetical protein